MTTRARLILFAITLVLALITLVPLRLALPPGLSAAATQGTIWHGQLASASFQGIGLGSLEVALHPLPLLKAERRLEVAGPSLTGFLILGEGVEAVTATPQVTTPITSLTTEALTLRFKSGLCTTASGRITVTLPGSPVPLTGTPRCNSTSALLPLTSADGLITTSATLAANGKLSLQ